uniref:Large ribosomal subunit protein uL5c n=1 Tax=Phacus pleuronectes TaxID=102908 RepID=A0A3G3LLV2_9EUGL|nr:ribosomal protein L5 [Phacus pleuronectes]AYQ93686.1 ribosomal protein L5 [Phacus pleuronectes]
MQRLKSYYLQHVIPLMIKKFNYSNINKIPKIKKIVINRGLNDSCQNSKVFDSLLDEMSIITGQRPFLVRSKRAIANFKLKQNMPVGLVVTLRGDIMYSFLDRLINLSLPRIKDFSGLDSRSFDKMGNYSLGFSEQLMFPEIEFDKVVKVQGMNVVIVMSGKVKKEESFFLLKELGLPFRK